ncbi:MAG: ABC transporter permease [Ilumatobacter sp.]|uniref:ABC transporter permease n=1 Tax=Ilumatobacter sp. TaxID=1967498 RepID=UPI00391C7D61
MTTTIAIEESAAPAVSAGRRRLLAATINSVAIGVVVVTMVCAVLAPLLTDFEPNRASPVDRFRAWGEDGHLLGTDQLGRDIFTRLVYGARLVWIVGLSVAMISMAVGATLGSLAGYLGGRVDAGVTRIADGILAFPPLLLALVLAAVMSPSTRTAIFALSIVYTPLIVRVSRAAVLGERTLGYVQASKGLGNSESRTLLRHILPNVVGPLLVVGSVVVSRAIIVEASLSFLGAGTQPPNPNWGVMIADARDLIFSRPSQLILPAIVLSVTVLSLNLVSDALSDRIDPRYSAKGGSR